MLSGGGLSELALSELDLATTGLEFTRLCEGRNPRLVLDFEGGCLRQDLHLFHFATGGGLRRRAASERWIFANTTAETNDTNLQIEDAFRTTDRRVSVVYSERDPGLGTYELKRIDSTPYPPKKAPPEAPRFYFTNTAYIPFSRGGWWNDTGIPITQPRTMAVIVQGGTVHGVELECSSYFPAGFQPPIWTEQVQDFTPGGVLGNGFVATFPISLTHGGNSMSPCSFRARCRDDSDPLVPCYSPWRYYLAGYYKPTELAVASYTPSVPLEPSSACICPTLPTSILAGGRLWRFTTEKYYIGVQGSSFCPCSGGVLATGFPTGAGSFLHHWLFRRRATMSVGFIDENMRWFGFELLSIESNSSGEGAPLVSLDSDQHPLDFE